VLPAAAGLALAALEPSGDIVDPFDIPGGWRIGEPAEVTWKMTVTGTTVANMEPNEVRARGRAADALVAAGDAAPVRVRAAAGSGGVPGAGGRVAVTVDGITRDYAVARDGATLWLGRDGQAWAIREQAPLEAAAAAAAGSGGPVVSPMPGTVTVVEVTEGQAVTAGQRLLVVEAMKMEHVLAAPVDGIVRDLRAKPGATVAKDAVLAVVQPAPETPEAPVSEAGEQEQQ
jgi:acetyl-CoA/propionyl-CoA carboxylase biotin carboxyl carrier protein